MKTPKHHITLQFCWSYAELVDRIQNQKADEALLGYALYYASALDVLDPTLTMDDWKRIYRQNTSKNELIDGLTTFAQTCIMQNIARYVEYLLERADGYMKSGGAACGPDGKIITPSVGTYALAKELLRSKQIANSNAAAVWDHSDTMASLTGALLLDAVGPENRILPEQFDVMRVSTLIELLRDRLNGLTYAPNHSTGVSQSVYLANGTLILKAAIAINAMMRDVDLDKVRSDRYGYLGMLPDGDSPAQLQMSDMTLAALPRPTQNFIQLCQSETSTSSIGRVYIKLHQLVVASRHR